MIKNPVAVITGAGRGIGRSISIGLAQDGYKTVLISRTKKELETVTEEIRSILNPGQDLLPLVTPLDVTEPECVNDLVSTVYKKFGRIDVLVNNAGLWISGSVNITIEEFNQLLDSNLKSAFYFLKEIIPIMERQEKGYIFNISSRAGKIGFMDSGGYSAAKFALRGLSESLCRELSPKGIKVTAICPGWVDTTMAQEADTPLSNEEMIHPDDIMKTIRWLLDLSPVVAIKDVLIECRNNIA